MKILRMCALAAVVLTIAGCVTHERTIVEKQPAEHTTIVVPPSN